MTVGSGRTATGYTKLQGPERGHEEAAHQKGRPSGSKDESEPWQGEVQQHNCKAFLLRQDVIWSSVFTDALDAPLRLTVTKKTPYFITKSGLECKVV